MGEIYTFGKGVKWYSIQRVNIEIDGNFKTVYFPVCFLKQICNNISREEKNGHDYILDGNEYELERALPAEDKYVEKGEKRIKSYWGRVIPKSLYSHELNKKMYKIIRIASCACILSCEKNKDIDTLGDIIKNSPENWQKYSMKIRLIEDAILDTGKIIAPLEGGLYFTGWKVICMIYAMLWCNSNIKYNSEEILIISKTMLLINSYIAKLPPDLSYIMRISDFINDKVNAGKLSGEAWVIIFLYVRNWYWYWKHVSNIYSLINFPNFSYGVLKRLRTITQKCLIKNDNDFIKMVKKLPTGEFDWIISILLGDSCRKNASSNRYNLIRQLKSRLKPVMESCKYSMFRLVCKYSNSLDEFSTFKNINVGFWICVEMMIYNSFSKVELPTYNKLDFIRDVGIFDSFSRGRKMYSIFDLSKGMINAAQRDNAKDWYEFSQYESVYGMVTSPIKEAIANDENIGEYFEKYRLGCWHYQNQLKMLLNSISGD